jgi:hypothetical protein
MTVEQLDSPGDHRRELDRLATSIDSHVERAIRNWSGIDERVQRVLKQVDERRINYLASLIRDLGQPAPETALELAIIEYSVFVGFRHLFPNADAHQIEQLINRVNHMTSAFNY